MTVMWAGPLATRRLAELGADVVKVEPSCRLDGTRDTPMYDALNAGNAGWTSISATLISAPSSWRW